MSAPMDLDEFCRRIGRRVLNTAPVSDLMGWSTPQGVLSYDHTDSPDAIVFRDFLLWAARRDRVAGARLLATAADWGVSPESLMADMAVQLGLTPTGESA